MNSPWLPFAYLLLGIIACNGQNAKTLRSVLERAKVPLAAFSLAEQNQKLSSFATADSDPFLLAYYNAADNVIQPPLHVVRYRRASGELLRSEFREVSAMFQQDVPMDCLGSLNGIQERAGTIYLETHINPSAGCVIVLSADLQLRSALSGWLLCPPGEDYAIVQASEVHFMAVHPLHVKVFDRKQNNERQIYPYPGDPERRRFTALLAKYVSQDWCRQANAPCDPDNPEASIRGDVAFNESARVVGFVAVLSPVGFGPRAEAQVPETPVAYVFRYRAGEWQHREFPAGRLEALFGVATLNELVLQKPDTLFAPAAEQRSRSPRTQ